MDNRELAMTAAGLLSSKKAVDITIIDIGEKSGFADFFVIACAGSKRQLQSLCDDLQDKLAEQDVFVRSVEGKGDSGWILMDYGDIIVNLFTEEQRQRYQIEKIWSDCVRIDYEGEE
jgi:ribosome-associated protein